MIQLLFIVVALPLGMAQKMFFSMKLLPFGLLAVALIVGCSNVNDNESAVADKGIEVHGDTLYVSEASPIASKIVNDTASAQDHDLVLSTTGVVTAIPSAYAEVAAPFAGRVVKSMVRIGQRVKAGAPLFEISASEYSEVVKNYMASKSEMELAKKVLERVRDLRQNKVASEKDFDEAQQSYTLALEEYRHALAVAKEYQIDLSGAVVGQPMVVRSPISGTVLRNELVIGEYLKEDADAKIVVADLGKVWVKANVSEMESPYVAGVKEVEVRLSSRPDTVILGHVAYTDGMLDAETRTMKTFIECDNPNGLMKPNMYASVNMSLKGQRHIIISKAAALQSSKGRYVLRKVGDKAYVKAPIEAQSIGEGRLLVSGGLAVGDVIMTEGAIYFIDCK